MLLFVVRCLGCARMRARVCVIHWHCTAQLSMFNMEKRSRNKIIIIIIITCESQRLTVYCGVLTPCRLVRASTSESQELWLRGRT